MSPILGSLLALIVWFAPFFAFPIFCVLALLAVIFMIKEPPKEKEAEPLKRLLEANSKRFLGKKDIGSSLHFSLAPSRLFILFGVLFYLSQILEEEPYSIEGVRKGLILAIPLLCMVITSYTTGAKIKQNGTLMRWLMNIGLILMTVSLALAIFLNANLYVFIGLLITKRNRYRPAAPLLKYTDYRICRT